MSMPDYLGYAHPDYALSLRYLGEPRELPRSGGWIITRPIAGTPFNDAIGCYPLFSCRDWTRLHEDLDDLKNDLVSVSMVMDPLQVQSVRYLQRCFQNVVIPFKEHFIVDLSCSMEGFICRHHARYAKKACNQLLIEKVPYPQGLIDEWEGLYRCLIARHRIKGVAAFTREAFVKQLSVPGVVAFRAVHEGQTIGMQLWYMSNDAAYYHLSACNAVGYELHASYGLFWFAIAYFKGNNLRLLNLGGSAGHRMNKQDGLAQFKRGWSTGTWIAYFCHRIMDQNKYEYIIKTRNIIGSDHFPIYRTGESY